MDLSGPARVIRTDPTVDFSWGLAAPAFGVSSNRFSVRWIGQLEAPVTGAYRLSSITDGGVRVWLDGALVINQWTPHSSATHTSDAINLVAGRRYAIRMEYFDVTGTAISRLMWEYPGTARQIVPQARLFPPDTTYLSDMQWTSATNGIGPVERDKSVGANGSGDGRPITINGVKFVKGLGVRAPSEIRYALNNRYTDFAVSIGIDDAVPAASGQARFQIFRDGVKAYESPTMGGNSAARYVEVDVTGVNELKLVVVDTGGGASSDHADWADAQVWRNERPYLTDFRWKSMDNGWGPAELDQSNGERSGDDGRMMSIARQVYARGLGVHAVSDVRYDLAGRFTRFTSMVGVDDEVPLGQGSVIFQVFADGLKLYESPMMKSGDAAKAVDVDVNGRRELRLVALTATNGNSYDHGDWASAQLTRGVVVPPSLPGAPTGLSAEGLNDRVSLTWRAATGATSYRIFRTLTSNAANATQIGTANDLDYVDRAVDNGTKYFYKVVGVNGVGAGPASNEASATPQVPAPDLPGAPTNLSARLANGNVNLDWNAAPRATSYNVYRRAAGGAAAVTSLATGVTRTDFVDSTAAAGTQYYYKVAGVNVTGVGPMSNEATTTTAPNLPTAPTGLSAAAGDKQVKLTWNAAAGATSYSVFRNGAAVPMPTGVTATTFTDINLTNGTKYSYTVAGVNTAGTGPKSNSVDATPQSALPDAPSGLSAKAGDKEVTLTWAAAARATTYNVFRDGNATPVARGISATTYADKNLTNGTKYTYTVAGVNAAGTGPMSNLVTSTPLAPLPAAPAGLSAAAGDKQVSLTWTAAANATSYNVYRNGAAAAVATGITDVKYTDTNLTNGTKYTYTVAGANGTGTGPKSNAADATPQVSAAPAPTNFTATPGDRQVSLAWAAAPGATTYNVYRATSGGTALGTPLATNNSGTTYIDSSVTNGTQYFYRVAGVNAAGVGTASSEASATPQVPLPVIPTGLTATSGDREVRLSWSAVPGAATYNVYRALTANGQGTMPLMTGIAAPSHIDTGLTNGTQYFYKVAAVNAAGTSALSLEVNSTPNPVTQPPSDAIHRFLRQSSWGPTQATMDRVRQIGIDAYLDEQFNTPATAFPDTLLTMPLEWSQEQMAKNAMSGPDQLRQRVAWSLHKIWVVSGVEVSDARAFLQYYRTILNGSFGNYYDLMRNVTLAPAMGEYLDMVNNFKATPGNEPNENYARELMQLFTIGLVRLNPDGSVQTDGTGAPIQTYSQEDVLDLSRALTGWTYGDAIAGNPTIQNSRNYNFPMEPIESQHDNGSKTFLGQFVPASQTATQDLDRSLQIIFNHPNVGPFVCKNLIQQLVTSNPSAAYIQRVAAVFDNNGSGVRGDLRAVVRAILKDQDAALGQNSSGHLREPILFMTNILRGLGATVADHPILTDGSEEMSQRIFYSPSVFSYFSPNYRVGGVPGPEFQIYTSFTALRRPNWVARLLNGGYGTDIVIDYTAWTAAAADANTLVDRCNTLLMGGQMSAQMRQSIVTAVNASPGTTEKVRTALYLTLTSSQYQVEH